MAVIPDHVRPSVRIDPTRVRSEIDALRAAEPSLWSDRSDAALADMLEGETGLYELLAAIVNRIHEASAFSAGVDLLIADYEIRRERYNGRVANMRALALKLMTWADVPRVQLPQATLSIRAGQPKVIITDPDQLPDDCVRHKYEPNKQVIANRIAAGTPVPGAEISNAEPVLSVRIK